MIYFTNVFVWILVASAAGTVSVQGRRFVEMDGIQKFSGRVIVRPLQEADLTKQGRTGPEIAAIKARGESEIAKNRVVSRVDGLDLIVLEVPAGSDENMFIELLTSGRNEGIFEFAEPDFIYYPAESVPNDPLFGSTYHHVLFQSSLAWDLSIGSEDVTVAICDTGIASHPDLNDNRKEGYNAVDRLWESQGGDVSYVHSHGTDCAGCAAAIGNNGIGVTGMGWNITHRPMRVSNTADGHASLTSLVHCAEMACAMGDKVISISYSGVGSQSMLTAATQCKASGSLVVHAAGNDGANLNWSDRDADDLIVVGATSSEDDLAFFSAYGPSVDVFAPGIDIQTTTLDNGYAFVSGTSFSCPLVAGLVALIWSANPSLTPNQVEQVLKESCDDIGAPGEDSVFGHGRVNSFRALTHPLMLSSRMFYLINPQSDKALDVSGTNCADGTNIHLYTRNGSAAQIFRYENGSIINVACNKAIDVDSSNCSSDTNIHLWTTNGAGAQQFRFDSDGTIVNTMCNMVVDIVAASDGGDGSNIISYPKHGGWNQQWRIEYI